MKSKPILQVIQEMVGAQRTLLSAFFDQFHHLRDHEALLDYPRSGQVRALGSIWSFRKHGMGVRFEDEESGRVIDVHAGLRNGSFFDAWRLGTYLRSVGNPIEDEDLKSELTLLEGQGALE